jgi:foldase protein PrsA
MAGHTGRPATPRTPPAAAQPIVVQPKDSVATYIDARPVAIINGQTILWGDLRQTLTEAAGADALREAVLDQQLADAAKAANLRITDEAIAHERKLLLESLSDDPEKALRLLDEMRDRQSLGPRRFDDLLRRRATLRALVRDKVEIDDAAIRQLHDMIHGPKRQVRIMKLPSLEAAETALRRLSAGQYFGDVAAEMSLHESASRGGLLQPISRSDPALPRALRDAIFGLEVGQTSRPILLEDGYALVRLERSTVEDSPPIQDLWLELQRLARLRQEQALMDQLEQAMVAGASLTIFDDDLGDAWARRGR